MLSPTPGGKEVCQFRIEGLRPRMEDFLRLGMTGAEGGIEFEFIRVGQEGVSERHEHSSELVNLLKCFKLLALLLYCLFETFQEDSLEGDNFCDIAKESCDVSFGEKLACFHRFQVDFEQVVEVLTGKRG